MRLLTWTFLSINLSLLHPIIANSSEFVFRLPPSQSECYYDQLEINEMALLEYEVVSGGNLDVDVVIVSPSQEVLYAKSKSKSDSVSFTAQEVGVYGICFDNEFSTVTGKDVYVYFLGGNERPLRGVEQHATVLTQMEVYGENIFYNLEKASQYQSHHRAKEYQGQKFANSLNEKVLKWCILEVLVMLVIGMGQIYLLKRFFTDKKTFVILQQ